jgi:hypothetical protein
MRLKYGVVLLTSYIPRIAVTLFPQFVFVITNNEIKCCSRNKTFYPLLHHHSKIRYNHERWKFDSGNWLTVSENTKTLSYCISVKMLNLTPKLSKNWRTSGNLLETVIIQPVPISALAAPCIFENPCHTDEINCCCVSSCGNINTGKPWFIRQYQFLLVHRSHESKWKKIKFRFK